MGVHPATCRTILESMVGALPAAVAGSLKMASSNSSSKFNHSYWSQTSGCLHVSGQWQESLSHTLERMGSPELLRSKQPQQHSHGLWQRSPSCQFLTRINLRRTLTRTLNRTNTLKNSSTMPIVAGRRKRCGMRPILLSGSTARAIDRDPRLSRQTAWLQRPSLTFVLSQRQRADVLL